MMQVRDGRSELGPTGEVALSLWRIREPLNIPHASQDLLYGFQMANETFV